MSIQNHMNNNQSRNESAPQNLRQSPRTRFLLFIKILFQLLEKSEDELLLEQARLAVVQCRYNVSSDLLEKAVEQELHSLVGGTLFAKAKQYMSHYVRTKQQRALQQQAAAFAKESLQQQKKHGRQVGGNMYFYDKMFENEKLFAELEPSPLFESI